MVATIATVLCIGTASAYAINNPALITGFFVDGLSSEVKEDVYKALDKTIMSGNYSFTFEGYIYSPKIHTGYLTVRVNRLDGSSPDITGLDAVYYSTDQDKPAEIPATIRNYRIDKDMYSLILDREDIHIDLSKIEKKEDGTYFFYKFADEVYNENFTSLRMCFVDSNELKSLFNGKSAMSYEEGQKFIFENWEGIKLDVSMSDSNVVHFKKDGNIVTLSRIGLFLEQTDCNNLISDFTITDGDGNNIEIMKDGEVVSSKKQWNGPSLHINEDGTRELYYTFTSSINVDNLIVEMNGIKYKL